MKYFHLKFSDNKKKLLRWTGWFFFGNSILFLLIGLHYFFSGLPFQEKALTFHGQILMAIFLVSAYIGQLSLLALAPIIIVIPFVFCIPKRSLIFLLSTTLATICASLLVADTFVYQLFHFHLNSIVLNIIMSPTGFEILDLSWLETALIFLIIISIFLIEWIYAIFIWRRMIDKRSYIGLGKWIVLVIFTSIYLSYSIVIFSSKMKIYNYFSQAARVLPYYDNMLGFLSFNKWGLIGVERVGEGIILQSNQASRPLNYPLAKMQCSLKSKPYNLVMIVIDTWRFDTVNKRIMPNITQFANNSWLFENHYSGGDATRPGIFSIFYSIPSTYWTSMEMQHKGPIFISELLKAKYNMGIFTSAPLNVPAFNRTVFQEIKNLHIKTPGNTPYQRDQKITKEFKKFVTKNQNKKHPFFTFLFYDGAHGFCDDKQSLKPFTPVKKVCNRLALTNNSDPLPYLNRYKNALYHIDAQVETVLQTLKKKHLLKNTVVLITGDHGEEFNDNHLGYWGHASNFTHYQVQTPLIIHWPKQSPSIFKYKTSHYDITPTLLTNLLGCTNPSTNYSVGQNLLSTKPRNYLVVGSYIDFGIIEKDRIITIYPSGNYLIDKKNGQPIIHAKLDQAGIRKVYNELVKFYKR